MSLVKLCEEESFQSVLLLGWSRFEVIQISLMKSPFIMCWDNSNGFCLKML